MAKRLHAERPSEAMGSRELIVVTRAGAEPSGAPGLESIAAVSLRRGLKDILRGKMTMAPLFPSLSLVSAPGLESTAMALSVSERMASRSSGFMHVTAPDEQLDELAERLRGLDEIVAAYVKPAAETAAFQDAVPSDIEPPAVTPDYTARQIYLNAAPAGIDAKYAWQFQGGRGSGVQIIDCEWGWRFTHEDLQSNQGGVIYGTASTDDNHGTAVLGEFSGDANAFGVVGICSEAKASAASFAGANTATVITEAANKLSAGDILLLEIHRQGPDGNGTGQDGYIAVEWWPDDLLAIQYAINRGIIVVEAAGNGARNLDAAVFETPSTGFPADWRNPFNLTNPSSGAIVVGAGAPPPGTHGRDHGPDRSRLDFSNYGRRVDTQGWGREVTSTGYGDLQGGSNRDLWYTDTFSGTSSASPIVVGALGCVQGILRSRSLTLLTPARALQLLRSTGSPQQDAPGRPRTQRIGNRPNLRELIPAALGHTPTPDFSEIASSAPEGRSKVTIRVGGVTITIDVEAGSSVSVS